MRYFITFLSLLLLLVGCRKPGDPAPADAAVASLSDLPASYQPFAGVNTVAGRLKREARSGKTSSEWRYNERGQLTEWRIFRSDAVESAVQYRYDREGRLRFVQHFSNNCSFSSASNCSGPVEWTSYDELATDAAGRVVESRTYLGLNSNWDYRSKSTYEYNPQGQLTKVLRVDAKGVRTLTQTFTYDSRGNVVAVREQSTLASPDLADRTFTYEYDTGRNPYFNTVYWPAALFLSRNTQLAPGLTYEYRPDGLPVKIHQSGGAIDLEYY
jgi:YD repeat-containing protein